MDAAGRQFAGIERVEPGAHQYRSRADCKRCARVAQAIADERRACEIDAESLTKYRVFQKLGYFGIQANARRGAIDFMDQANYVLQSDAGSLWITPEGRFTDVRDHQQPLMPGLAHLAAKIPNIHCIPLAIEYVFSQEQHPLLLCKLGSTLTETVAAGSSKLDWQSRLTERLRTTQTALADAVIAKRWETFYFVVRSKRQSR